MSTTQKLRQDIVCQLNTIVDQKYAQQIAQNKSDAVKLQSLAYERDILMLAASEYDLALCCWLSSHTVWIVAPQVGYNGIKFDTKMSQEQVNNYSRVARMALYYNAKVRKLLTS